MATSALIAGRAPTHGGTDDEGAGSRLGTPAVARRQNDGQCLGGAWANSALGSPPKGEVTASLVASIGIVAKTLTIVYQLMLGRIYATRMESQEHRDLVRANLGERIRQLRMEQQLSQHRFSRMVDIDRTYLIGIEKGRRNPSIDNIVKIADGLDISLVDLFKGVDVEYDPNEYHGAARTGDQSM